MTKKNDTPDDGAYARPVRLKLHVPSEAVYGDVERMLDTYGVAIYTASEKRLSFSTGELSEELQAKLAKLGCTVGEDRQYDLG